MRGQKTSRLWWFWVGVCLAALGMQVGCAVPLPSEEPEVPGEEEPLDQAEHGIVGGQPTNLFPAVGALVYQGHPFCTGTLITPTTVLTAAHCVVGMQPHEVLFVLGSDGTRPHTVLEVTALQPHPDYYDLQHDVARLRLGSPASVPPMGVVQRMDASFVGRPLVFIGYGVSDGQRQTGGGRKRSVAVPIHDLAPTTFSYRQEGGGTCHGDSGGPALHQDEEGRWLVAGVTSYGDATCRRFGVDTRVDTYLGFVLAPWDGPDDASGGPGGGAGDGPTDADPEVGDPGTSPPSGSPSAEEEPNDSRSESNRLEEPQRVRAAIGEWGDRDWFRLVLPAAATLDLKLSVPPDVDYDVILYGADGKRLATSEQDVGLPEALRYTNPWTRTRVLYLKVYGYEGSWSAVARYRLDVDW